MGKRGRCIPRELILVLILGVTLTFLGSCLQAPGPKNQFYDIPKYYGSRVRQYLTKDAILFDEPVELLWSTNLAGDDEGNLWIAHKDKHTIQYIEAETKALVNVAGTYETPGNHTGSVLNALFRNPVSLFVYKKDYDAMQTELNKVTIIIDSPEDPACARDSFSWSSLPDCITPNGEKEKSVYDAVDRSQIRHLDFATASQAELNTLPSYLNDNNSNLSKVQGENRDMIDALEEERLAKEDDAVWMSSEVIIADQGNNCIRSLNVIDQELSVVGGTCDNTLTKDGPSPVFLDGSLGSNRVLHPKTITVDVFGNIFVNDQGNEYIRMIERRSLTRSTRSMSTLIHGACGASLEDRAPTTLMFGVALKWSSCYRSWRKTYGLPEEHVVSDEVDEKECLNHQVICESGGGRYLIRASNSIYVERNLGASDNDGDDIAPQQQTSRFPHFRDSMDMM